MTGEKPKVIFSTIEQGMATTMAGLSLVCRKILTGILASKIHALSTDGDYVLIGHSLGGVLIRAAVASLPAGTRLPRQIFLLGSRRSDPRDWIYRVMTGDCGQLLASPSRMKQIEAGSVPTTSILGVTGWTGRLNPFDGEMDDGIVSVSEASAAWIAEEIRIQAIHATLPSNSRVSRIILERIASQYDAT